MTDTDTIRRNDIDAQVAAMKDIRRQAIDDCKAVLADRIAAEEAYCRPLKGNARGTSNAILAALSGLASRLEALKDTAK